MFLCGENMQVQLFHMYIDNAEFWHKLQQFALMWVNPFFRLRDVTCNLLDEPFDIITQWLIDLIFLFCSLGQFQPQKS